MATVWVREMTRDFGSGDRAWIKDFVEAYAAWTRQNNGAGLERQAETDRRGDLWNGVYFPLAAEACAHMPRDQSVKFIAAAIDVPDKSFFNIVEGLVPALDQITFIEGGLNPETAFGLRMLIVDRMLQTIGWRREQDRTTMSIAIEIGPAIASLFFCHFNSFIEPRCYLLPRGLDRVDSFLPLLTRLIAVGSVPFTVQLTLNLLEVSPRTPHLPFLLGSALVWLHRQPTNTELWIDRRFGVRVVRWLAGVFQSDLAEAAASSRHRVMIDEVLARLVQLGVAEAHQLEGAITTADTAAGLASILAILD